MRKRPDFEPSDGEFHEEDFTPEECGWAFGGLTSLGHTIYEKPNGKLYIFERGKPLVITKLVED